MNKDIKYLIEDIINFNPIEYNDDENEVVSYEDIANATNVPTTTEKLKNMIRDRVRKNPINPDLSDITTSYITDMSRLFFDDEFINVLNLDLSAWDTSNVVNMSHMFCGLINLKTLRLSDMFDTSRVKSMNKMFKKCEKLIELDLSNFNTSRVTSMAEMFSNCWELEKLDISNFNTSKVRNMHGMFMGTSTTMLDLSSFNTSNVTDMSEMFDSCNLLTELDLSNFDFSSVKNTRKMFKNCNLIKKLNLLNFNCETVDNTHDMFLWCGLHNVILIITNDIELRKYWKKYYNENTIV